jgi:hypothetical protein
MRLRRNVIWTLGILVGAVGTAVVAIVVGLIFRGEYTTAQTVRREFTIDEDFTSVRKILVRNESAKQIIAMGGGSEFISQNWTAGGAEVDSVKLLDPEWRLQLHGMLRVRTKDDYIGQHEIDLEQDVEIEPDYLHSDVDLVEPSGRLQDYEMTTRFERDRDGVSRVKLSLMQEIVTDAPWFAHGIADRRVRASAERTLANQEAAIRQLVADKIDEVPLFPLR